jgi:hypothetical protein
MTRNTQPTPKTETSATLPIGKVEAVTTASPASPVVVLTKKEKKPKKAKKQPAEIVYSDDEWFIIWQEDEDAKEKAQQQISVAPSGEDPWEFCYEDAKTMTVEAIKELFNTEYFHCYTDDDMSDGEAILIHNSFTRFVADMDAKFP